MPPAREGTIMRLNKKAVETTFGAGLVVALVSVGCGGAMEPEGAASTGEAQVAQVEQQAVCEDCPPPTGGGTGGGASIRFYEGNGATQDMLGAIGVTSESHFYDLTSGGNPIPNDEARSMELRNIKKGTTIILCDDPHPYFPLPGFLCGGNKDDILTILVREDISMATIGTFEQSATTATYYSTWKQAEPGCIVGLDGKVSMIKIYPPGTTVNSDCAE